MRPISSVLNTSASPPATATMDRLQPFLPSAEQGYMPYYLLLARFFLALVPLVPRVQCFNARPGPLLTESRLRH